MESSTSAYISEQTCVCALARITDNAKSMWGDRHDPLIPVLVKPHREQYDREKLLRWRQLGDGYCCVPRILAGYCRLRSLRSRVNFSHLTIIRTVSRLLYYLVTRIRPYMYAKLADWSFNAINLAPWVSLHVYARLYYALRVRIVLPLNYVCV